MTDTQQIDTLTRKASSELIDYARRDNAAYLVEQFLQYSYGADRERLGEEALERTLTIMLRSLPIAVVITKRDNPAEKSKSYIWQTYDKNGEVETFTQAVEEALFVLFGVLFTLDRSIRGVPTPDLPEWILGKEQEQSEDA